LGFAISSAFSQVVNFNNANLPEPPDRTVYMPDMVTPLVGSPTTEAPTFVAQLYYGADGADADSLQAVSYPPARFRPAGVSRAGEWLGGTRTLAGFTVGQTVTLQVRAWSAGGIGLTYDEARTAGGFWGDSATFTYRIPPNLVSPDAYYMYNFQSFSLVPEPSSIALVVAGAIGLLLSTRRKHGSVRLVCGFDLWRNRVVTCACGHGVVCAFDRSLDVAC
jgi:hypothetical protein